jgi:LmbE family N-acetylglucosaminyl deacetylase
MIPLPLVRPGESLSVLCLGAHADDIEIGAGGTILGWIAAGIQLEVDWCVLSADNRRADEAQASAAAFLSGAVASRVRLATFPDNRFPSHSDAIREWLLAVRDEVAPRVILTHQRGDAHQDHREVCQLTWNLFRDHLILEYEIPKWDGDLGQPNVYVSLADCVIERKIELLLAHFGTQRSKDWFQADTFRALARLRGIECRAPHRWAEAFYCRKVLLA